MKKILQKIIFASLALISMTFISCSSKQNTEPVGKNKRPNIIYILADDLGYGELGCYGQEKIETPNIDKLAETGMRFTQHYAGAPVCAPSRCVLLTGKHTGHAQIRGNDEWGSRGDVWNYVAMLKDSTLEGQRPLEEATVTIASLLQAAGYKTGMIGKWGLGAPNTNSIPTKMGFDFFTGINCQRMAHTFYPVNLYENNHRVYIGNDTVPPHSKLNPSDDPYDLSSYKRFNLQTYSCDVMFEAMSDFIKQNCDSSFFFYWASPIPHAPLQAPQRWIDNYFKKYGDENPYLADKGYFPQRYPHAAYAAMVSYLDENVGKMVQQLKELGIYENTVILFSSDNGPTYNGGTDSPWFNSAHPFSSEQGRGKGFVYEGGIRVPMIVSWPGHIQAGAESNHISAFFDVMPTICDITGIDSPEGIDGISFYPALLGQLQKPHDYLYWEFPEYNGQQAVRMGNWKGIRKDIRNGNMKLELYNLENDLTEQKNIADQHPDVIHKMEEILIKEHIPAKLERFRMKELGD